MRTLTLWLLHPSASTSCGTCNTIDFGVKLQSYFCPLYMEAQLYTVEQISSVTNTGGRKRSSSVVVCGGNELSQKSQENHNGRNESEPGRWENHKYSALPNLPFKSFRWILVCFHLLAHTIKWSLNYHWSDRRHHFLAALAECLLASFMWLFLMEAIRVSLEHQLQHS